MVCARHFCSAGPVVRNVGGVKCPPCLKLVMNTKNVLKVNRALLLLVSNKSSDYGTGMVAKLSLYSTCTWSTVNFCSVKK